MPHSPKKGIAGTMERVLLSALGGQRMSSQMPRPPMDLADLDAHALYLQVNAIEWSTLKNYATGVEGKVDTPVYFPIPR